MKIFDISVPVTARTPLWPGTTAPTFPTISKLDGSGASNETWISMSPHTGTHLDAPLHFLRRGGAIEKVALDACVGKALVVHLPKAKEIGVRELDAARIPTSTKRILFKTSNGARWKKKSFDKNFVGLTADGAAWLAKRNVVLVGVDYLSVAAYDHVTPVHETLLQKKVVLLEGVNLSVVPAGAYELLCPPLALVGTEAAPVRALLVKR